MGVRRLSPGVEETIQRRMSALCMGVMHIVAAQRDHFFVAMDRGFVVFVAVVAEKTLHQPCLGVMGINVQNSVEKNLGHLPTFFRNGSRSVAPIHANHGVIAPLVVMDWRFEHCDSQHRCMKEI
jgi:hypothetical protein